MARIRPLLRRCFVWLLLFGLTTGLSFAIAPVRAKTSVVCADAISCPAAVATTSLMQQGKALYDAGKFAEAIAVLKQAAQAYQNRGDGLRQAIALSNLSLAYQQLGQWKEARDAIAESLRLLGVEETGDRRQETGVGSKIQNPKSQISNLPTLAQALDIQGNLQLAAGETEQALTTWQRAEAIYKRLNDANGIVQNQMNQAHGLRVLGYYRRALTMLMDVRPTLQNQSNSMTKVIQLRSLGNALRLVGDLEQSRIVLRQSLASLQQLPTSQTVSDEMSATLVELGNTARAQQEITAATLFYQEAIRVAPSAIAKVQAQINLFSLLLDNQQSSTLGSLYSEIQTQLETLPLSQTTIYAHIHFAQLLQRIKTGQPIQTNDPNFRSPLFVSSVPRFATKSTAQLLATAVQQARQLSDRRAEAFALGTLGGVYEANGQWQEAQTLTQQALNVAEAINASDISYRWHWQMGRLLKQQGQITAAIAAYDAAVAELRSLRSDLVGVNREVQFSFRESVEPVYRESVELLVQPHAGKTIEQNLDKARRRIEALQLAELDNFFREACLDTQTVLLDKVVDQDNPTAAVIYPMILPNQLEIIVKIPKQPLHHHTIQIPKQEVEHVLQQLQQNLTEFSATSKVQKLSQQVHSWLIEPIEPDLERQGVNTLVFVLDGALRSIPMAGLYDGKRYLVEKYAVALSVGLQLLPPKSLATEQLHVLAAGLIEPPPQFQQQFSPLPEIKSEFDLIAKTGIPTHQIVDQAFTSRALEQQISSTGFNVVHLATHGQFSSQAKDTFILAADGPINVTQLDSLLRSRSQTRSQPIELLVLSACQTAEGDDRATLGLAGVAVKAGARSTLASLWQIDDRSTALLMGEFYRELANSKVTKAEALRRAQLTIFKQYPNYRHTGFWAAYVLIGNWL